MAGSRKKTRRPSKSESDNSGSDGEESESGTYQGQKEIQATFEGRNPEGHDFHGIKQLLNQLFLKAHIDLSQMTDLLIAQHGVGSVLKQSYGDSDDEDEDVEMTEEGDVFGITSVVNLGSHKETPCIQQFYSLLEELCKKHADQATQANIQRILKEYRRVGFLINERFVNIPAQISVAMLNSLYDEIQRMKKKDASYEFEYYIMISKTCIPKDNKGDEVFSNDEEEIFSKNAEANFVFDVTSESDTAIGGKWMSDDRELVPHRRVLIFQSNKLKTIIDQITAFVHPNNV
ncbi:unnamed protein product [Phaedon cochleariae]|uniref:Protein BCCIP homolog n=1 Tax=Phaedon cochleariae TaxID=80249 RepID=A0A9N9X3H3_PHACE|nr:unnamed protein product [Phaedon cochleariae]